MIHICISSLLSKMINSDATILVGIRSISGVEDLWQYRLCIWLKPERLGSCKPFLSSSVKCREQCVTLALLRVAVKTKDHSKSERPLKNTKAHSNGCQASLEAAERLLTQCESMTHKMSYKLFRKPNSCCSDPEPWLNCLLNAVHSISLAISNHTTFHTRCSQAVCLQHLKFSVGKKL